ncbi:MAG: hypothetical protein DRI36_04870, partial [Caldiserica bacterium]
MIFFLFFIFLNAGLNDLYNLSGCAFSKGSGSLSFWSEDIFLNPAKNEFKGTFRLNFTTENLFFSKYNSVSLQYKAIDLPFYFGAGGKILETEPADVRDENAKVTGYFRERSEVYYFNLSRKKDNFRFGGNLKIYQESIYLYEDSSFGIDIGAVYEKEPFIFSLIAYNLLPVSIRLKDERISEGLSLRIGSLYKFKKTEFGLEFSLFTEKIFFPVYIGGVYKVSKNLMFGFGYNRIYGFSSGIEISWRDLLFSFSIQFHELRNILSFSFSYEWGKGEKELVERMMGMEEKLRIENENMKRFLDEVVKPLSKEEIVIAFKNFKRLKKEGSLKWEGVDEIEKLIFKRMKEIADKSYRASLSEFKKGNYRKAKGILKKVRKIFPDDKDYK